MESNLCSDSTHKLYLDRGSLKQAVALLEGKDFNEWIAVQINILYGTITQFCSPGSCPRMIGRDEYEYLWQDDKTNKLPTELSVEYTDNLVSWYQSYFFDNETAFADNDRPVVFRNQRFEFSRLF